MTSYASPRPEGARRADRIANRSKPRAFLEALVPRNPGTELAWHEPVTTRITVALTGNGKLRRIQVAGRLTGEEVGELEQTIGGDASGVCLELAELRSADAAGLAALRRLRAEGVEMRSVPPHLAWRIEGDPP